MGERSAGKGCFAIRIRITTVFRVALLFLTRNGFHARLAVEQTAEMAREDHLLPHEGGAVTSGIGQAAVSVGANVAVAQMRSHVVQRVHVLGTGPSTTRRVDVATVVFTTHIRGADDAGHIILGVKVPTTSTQRRICVAESLGTGWVILAAVVNSTNIGAANN